MSHPITNLQVLEERDKLSHRPPLLVKIAPDLSTKDKKDIADVVTRPKVSDPRLSWRKGMIDAPPREEVQMV